MLLPEGTSSLIKLYHHLYGLIMRMTLSIMQIYSYFLKSYGISYFNEFFNYTNSSNDVLLDERWRWCRPLPESLGTSQLISYFYKFIFGLFSVGELVLPSVRLKIQFYFRKFHTASTAK